MLVCGCECVFIGAGTGVFVFVFVFVFVYVYVCLCDLLLRRLLHGLTVLRLTNLKILESQNFSQAGNFIKVSALLHLP